MSSEVAKPWEMCVVVPGDGGHPELNLPPSLQELGAQGCPVLCVHRGRFFPFSLNSSFSSLDVKPGELQPSSPRGM